jgi:UDP:flavonoid glycosyltransferase YjiC (YdhE family)
VLGDSNYADTAGRLGTQIRKRNGADVGADAIEEFVRSRLFVDS